MSRPDRWNGGIAAAAFALACLASGMAQAQKGPAMQAYDRLSAAREQAEAVRDQDKDSPASRQRAETILRDALESMQRPDIRDLAEGNKFLRYRAYNLRADLFELYLAEGDKARALDVMAQMLAEDSAPLDLVYRSKRAQALLQGEPRYRAMLERADAMGRLWHARAIATPYTDHLSEAERIAGLSLFWSEVKYNFAHFNNVPGLDWDRAYLDFLPRVIAARDTRAYYEVLMRFAPLLHDGHTNIYPPKELQPRFYARPPLRTALIGGKVLVTFVGSGLLAKQGIRVGDEITAIDGIEVKRYARERVAPYESSSTPQDMAVRMYTYGLLAGDKDAPLKLDLDDGRGQHRTLVVARDNYPDRRTPPSFVFRQLPGGVAYLSLDQFETKASSEAFTQHLSQIMQAKALILDVRNNGGGSDRYGFEILSHLTAAPIPGPRSTELSVEPVERANGHLSLEWRPLDGSGASHPHQTRPIFNGPVAVLTSARTFSAAEDFVMAFDALKRGILVGQRTGGSTGMPMSFNLPGGGSARICVKWDSYPDGREFVGEGIAPDVEVAPSAADIRGGRDPVIERAAQLLRAESGRSGRPRSP